MPSLRLLSVNSKLLPLDRAGLARMIADHTPDVACVHGAPSLARWRSISAALARESGLVVVTGGRTSGGNLLLSSLGVDVTATRELSFVATHGVRPPGAALAALRLLGCGFLVAAARFGSSSHVHSAELRDAVAALVPDDPPVVLSIDGVGRGSGAAQLLGTDLVAVGGGVFVDARIAVDSADEITIGAVELELTVSGL